MTHRIWSHTLSRQTMSLVCSTQTRKNTLANIPIQDTCVTWSQLTILPYPRFVKIPKTIDHQLYQNLCKGYIQSLQNLCLENFQLFKIRITQRLVVVVDLSGVEEICEVIEKEHHRAHRGPKDMRPQLLEKLYFTGISSITCNELSSCECCKLYTYERHANNPIRQPTPVPNYPCEILDIDIFTLEKKIYQSCIDKFTKLAKLFPLESQSSDHLREKFVEVLHYFTVPRMIVTDNKRVLLTRWK